MITYLLYRFKVLTKGNTIHDFISMYYMTIDLFLIAFGIALIIDKWFLDIIPIT